MKGARGSADCIGRRLVFRCNAGAMLVIGTGLDEFYIAGTGLHVSSAPDPDVDDVESGIAGIEEVRRDRDRWQTVGSLNGDESGQERELLMASGALRIDREKLCSMDRSATTDAVR